MKKFSDYLYKYGLHDCLIDNILIEGSGLALYFNTGIYELTTSGTEVNKTPACKMIIEIDNLNTSKMWEHIQINKEFKKRLNEVRYNEFVKKIKAYKFDVIINYFSYFCNTILIEGYINNTKHILTISEVKKIEFNFSGK